MEALLLIDIQNDYFKGGKFPLLKMKRAAVNASQLLKRFREEGKTVIHIQHNSIKPDARFFHKGTEGAEIHQLVQPLENEKLFVKNYPNSFRNTGLDEYLKKLNITKLHIAGAMSNMCVDSTVRAGFDLGYSIVVHEKACAAKGILGTPLVHLISMKTLGSTFARIDSSL